MSSYHALPYPTLPICHHTILYLLFCHHMYHILYSTPYHCNHDIQPTTTQDYWPKPQFLASLTSTTNLCVIKIKNDSIHDVSSHNSGNRVQNATWHESTCPECPPYPPSTCTTSRTFPKNLHTKNSRMKLGSESQFCNSLTLSIDHLILFLSHTIGFSILAIKSRDWLEIGNFVGQEI